MLQRIVVVFLMVATGLVTCRKAAESPRTGAPASPRPFASSEQGGPCRLYAQSIHFDVRPEPAFEMRVQLGGAAPHLLQVDTGSVGIVVGYPHVGGTPTPVPPALLAQWKVPNYIIYDSTGDVMVGEWVYTSVNFPGGSQPAEIPQLPVLSVYKTCQTAKGSTTPPPGCVTPPPPLKPIDCTQSSDPLCAIGMMGVGFDRGAAMGTSAMNPFLHIREMDAQPPTMQRGYIISASRGITLGTTADDIAGFQYLPLAPSGENEWRQARGCVTITGGGIVDPGSTACGEILMDTGVDRMYLTYGTQVPAFNPPIPNTPEGGDIWTCQPAPCTIHGNAANASVRVMWPDAVNPVFTYTANAPRTFDPQRPDPIFAHVGHTPLTGSGEDVFVNTSRQLLYTADYLYDATCGRIGFRKLDSPVLTQ